MNERRQGSVKATTVCFVFCLARDDLNVVLNQFPQLRAMLEAKARERLQELYLSENKPIETIMELFSDSVLDSASLTSESESELSRLMSSRENETCYQESDLLPESDNILTVEDTEEKPTTATPTSTCTIATSLAPP